jgi:hypothetical protein
MVNMCDGERSRWEERAAMRVYGFCHSISGASPAAPMYEIFACRMEAEIAIEG